MINEKTQLVFIVIITWFVSIAYIAINTKQVEEKRANLSHTTGDEMPNEREHLQKKIDYLTAEVSRVASKLDSASNSPAKYSRIESELQQCTSDLENAKAHLAKWENNDVLIRQ